MARLLAIDYGTKRTGLAVSDPLQIIASPLTAVRTHELMSFIEDYVQKEDVESFVVGWPTKDDGSPTNNTRHVDVFVKALKKKFPHIALALQDEWNTSNMALESMIKGGVKKKDRRNKMNIDKTSAVLILQAYMEENK